MTRINVEQNKGQIASDWNLNDPSVLELSSKGFHIKSWDFHRFSNFQVWDLIMVLNIPYSYAWFNLVHLVINPSDTLVY